MTNEVKRVCQGILLSHLLIVQWTGIYCVDDNGQIISLQNLAYRAGVGESCWDMTCEENSFCNERYICECKPGYKVYNNECITGVGENEYCTKHEDCCGNLLCINGLCRKPTTGSEFVTLAKICLGITVTTIIIAVFSSLIKCLIRYENSGLPRFASSMPFRGQTSDPPPVVHDIRDEKPPSYEECMRSMARNPVVSPPPYIISSNSDTANVGASPGFFCTDAFVPIDSPNVGTPLNVQSLSNISNNNVTTPSQGSEKAQQNTV